MSLMAVLKDEFTPARFIPSALAGCITGILTVIVEISFAALIFSGNLSGFIYSGISFTLFGAFVIGMVVACTSSYPATIARPHEIPAAILALVVSAVAAGMPASASQQDVLRAIMFSIFLTSLVTGAFFLALGRLKLGSLIRFIPYPVVGGFLAGTGWLLVKGALGVMTGITVKAPVAARFFEPAVLTKWLPGLAFAAVLLFIMRRLKHFLVMPAAIVIAAAVFYLGLAVTHTSIAEASAQGWLLRPLTAGALWHPIPFGSIAHVDWPLIIAQAPQIGTILLLSVIPLLLNASGFELVVRRDIDFNRELQSAGIANMAAALDGGTVGLHSLSLSALAYTMGAKGRLVGIIAASLCGATLFFGSSLLVYFPKPILGGMLLFLGLGFLIEWVYHARRTLPRTDYVLVLLILLVIAGLGFLQGVAAGLLVAIALFVVNYSRVSIVKYELSGVNYHSNVERAPAQQRLLAEKGERLHLFRLQGFIFFGTANNLLARVRGRADDNGRPRLGCAVFDFSMVNGLDSSAVRSFVKMQQIASEGHFTLVFTGLSPELRRQFDAGGFPLDGDDSLRVFPDIDHGVEWCEDRVLAEAHAAESASMTFEARLREIFPPQIDISRFTAYLERREQRPGDYIMRQGDPCHGLFFIESGNVTVQLERENFPPVRLRAMSAGTVVGEVGLYLGLPASASVVTEGAAITSCLSPDALARMEKADPEIATAFHKYIIRLLGERLAYSNRSLRAVMD